MRHVAVNGPKRLRVLTALALAGMVLAIPAGAQKNKDKKKPVPASDSGTNLNSLPPASDSQAVDQTIGEALGYWQIGDIQSLHKYYADDVVVVSGLWEPPVIGWDNFLKAYQARRAQGNAERMDRSNTLIKVNGNFAWATYQFTYAAMKDNQVAQFRGHTTLILARQADRWVITLDHSSVVDSSLPTPAGPADSAAPARP
jgi:ketosteroid isomerase-like protein